MIKITLASHRTFCLPIQDLLLPSLYFDHGSRLVTFVFYCKRNGRWRDRQIYWRRIVCPTREMENGAIFGNPLPPACLLRRVTRQDRIERPPRKSELEVHSAKWNRSKGFFLAQRWTYGSDDDLDKAVESLVYQMISHLCLHSICKSCMQSTEVSSQWQQNLPPPRVHVCSSCAHV